MAAPVIVSHGLQKRFGDVNALGPLSVEIPRGAWGLLGPNGAGKTTLIRLLLGLTPATAGKVTVFGLDPVTESREIRERVGFAPEGDSYVPGLTGIRFVAYAARMHGLPAADAKQRAHEALNFVGLDEARYRDVGDYSQGMRQRAKLAAAIVHSPELIFLDEPTNGLDPDGREEMLALIRELAQVHDIAILFASHILPEVETVCDGALVLQQGQAVANDPLTHLSAVHAQLFLVRIRGDAPRFAQAIGQQGGKVARTAEGMLQVTLPSGRGPTDILQAAASTGAQVRHLEPSRVSLEETMLTALTQEAR